jgi:hypothetical protein
MLHLQIRTGIVREVVYVGEQTLRDLVKEWKATGPTYRTTLRTVIRNSYSGHYRQMVPQLLETLSFRSNNEVHQPVICALCPVWLGLSFASVSYDRAGL